MSTAAVAEIPTVAATGVGRGVNLARLVGAAGGHRPALPGMSRALDFSVPGQGGRAGRAVSLE
eukprot:3769262-Alexandrium_andersonii.AAC.1